MRRVSFIIAKQVPPSQVREELPRPQLAGLNAIRHFWIPAFAGMTILIVGAALATETFAAGPYKIDWYTIDGGGGTSSGGRYTLTGTIGQPDAGYSSNDKYELLGGFWSGGVAVCVVNLGELAAFCDHWLETGAGIKADLDKNNKVDFIDYSILVNLWLGGCPYP